MQGKISVIVPVYNIEKCVDRCVKSIVNQTYSNLEIILIDDGSTDKSGELCDKWASLDNRIIVLHKENEGLSDARNSGLDIATGEYIGFVDGDDWIAEDMYSYLYSITKATDADIAICGHYIVMDQGEVIENSVCDINIREYESVDAVWMLIQDELLHSYAWDKLYRRQLFDKIAYPSKCYDEDMFTTYRLFIKANKVVCGCELKYYYFQRSDSILQTRGEKLDWDQFCVYEEWYLELSKLYPKWEKYLLLKWLAFSVCAYNSLLLRDELGNETLERKQKMLDIIQKNFSRVKILENPVLKLRLFFILSKRYENFYPVLKRWKNFM